MSRIARLMSTVFSSKVVVFDDFNRADGALGNACTGQAWSVTSGTVVINSNMVMPSQSNTHNRAVIETGLSNVRVSATFVSGRECRLIFRVSDLTYEWVVNYAVGKYDLIRRNGATADFIDTASGLTYGKVSVTCVGNIIIVYLNGEEILSANDGFNNTATKHGVASYGTTGPPLFDDFSVEAI